MILIAEKELTLVDVGFRGGSAQIVAYISLFSPKKKLLIVGDTLNNRYLKIRLPPKSVSCDFPQAVDSIKQIARLDFETLCFGHGQPIIGHARARVQDLITKQGL